VANIQPYAYDSDRKAIVFVCASYDAINKSTRAFFYQGQRDLATRVFLVPSAAVQTLADKIVASKESNVGLDKVLLVQSTGRCGSTLLSRLLGTMSGVFSLSEPDIFSSLVFPHALDADKITRAELKSLIRACTIMLVHSTRAFQNKPNEHIALKFRSFATLFSDVFHESLPEAKVRHVSLFPPSPLTFAANFLVPQCA
jgi:hypothetical protein